MAESLEEQTFLAWADAQFPEFFPGDLVSYVGVMREAHGIWVVEFRWDRPTPFGSDRYQLKSYRSDYVKINADVQDLVSLYQTNQ